MHSLLPGTLLTLSTLKAPFPVGLFIKHQALKTSPGSRSRSALSVPSVCVIKSHFCFSLCVCVSVEGGVGVCEGWVEGLRGGLKDMPEGAAGMEMAPLFLAERGPPTEVQPEPSFMSTQRE